MSSVVAYICNGHLWKYIVECRHDGNFIFINAVLLNYRYNETVRIVHEGFGGLLEQKLYSKSTEFKRIHPVCNYTQREQKKKLFCLVIWDA